MMEKSSTEFGYLQDNIRRIRERSAQAAVRAGRDPDSIRLMAVTKTVPAELVNRAIACGVDLLGENRAQELNEKYDSYHRDGVEIHFIGRLQSNKVRQIADKVSMIHSLDSLKLAAEIDRQAAKLGRVMDVLIEVNVGGEQSKTGVDPEQAQELAFALESLDNVRLRGFMTIPPICDDFRQLDRYFSRMEHLLVDMQAKKLDNSTIDILSMGMSGDFEQAIQHGANIIRLGTALFGQREYSR